MLTACPAIARAVVRASFWAVLTIKIVSYNSKITSI